MKLLALLLALFVFSNILIPVDAQSNCYTLSNFQPNTPFDIYGEGEGVTAVNLCAQAGDSSIINVNVSGSVFWVMYGPYGEVARGQNEETPRIFFEHTGQYRLEIYYDFGTRTESRTIERTECSSDYVCYPVYDTEYYTVPARSYINLYVIYEGNTPPTPLTTAMPTPTIFVTRGPTLTPSQTSTPLPTLTPTATVTPTATITVAPEIISLTENAFARAIIFSRIPNPTNIDWIPQEITVIQNGQNYVMVLVPPGCFLMGADASGAEYNPAHRQCFDHPYWIDKFEVTNAQFGYGGQFRGANQPRESLDRHTAASFCASRGANVRLPTEREWEYAARGVDSWIYPWGNSYDGSDFHGYNQTETANVGQYPGNASWVGALDMIGNVWEWVSSQHQSYPFIPTADGQRGTLIARGAGWRETNVSLSSLGIYRSYYRRLIEQRAFSVYDEYTGFRCVWDMPSFQFSENALAMIEYETTDVPLTATAQQGQLQAEQHATATSVAESSGGTWQPVYASDGSFSFLVPSHWEGEESTYSPGFNFFSMGNPNSFTDLTALGPIPRSDIDTWMGTLGTATSDLTIEREGREIRVLTGESAIAVIYTPDNQADPIFVGITFNLDNPDEYIEALIEIMTTVEFH